MRVTIHYVVQAELTSLALVWTTVVKSAVNLTIVNATLSILTLAIDEVIVLISTAAFLKVK